MTKPQQMAMPGGGRASPVAEAKEAYLAAWRARRILEHADDQGPATVAALAVANAEVERTYAAWRALVDAERGA